MADFPASITDLGPGLSGVPLGPEHTAHHTALRDEVVAVQTELGVNPSGAAADVAARFAAVEADVAGMVAGPGAAEALVSALDQGATPATLVVLGDSTGTGSTGKWVEDLGVLIGARWPLRKVTLRTWDGTSAYGSPSTIANGSATPVLDIYNGSQGGAIATYPVSRIPAMIPAEPDAVVLSFGHNHGADTAADLEADLDALVAAVRAEWPGAPVIVSSQNPQVSPATTPANHNNRQASLRAWAASAGYGYVPAYEAFVAQVSPSAFIQADGIHPTVSGADDGSALWADAGLRTLAAASLAPVEAATGGVSTYVHRDRLVAGAGASVLTLGATPVAGSPLVWVDGVIQWPATDYTITGDTITFGAPLTAGDAVAVQYHSTTATYTAAVLTGGGVNIVADFTAPDSVNVLPATSTGGAAWAQHTGTWGTMANKAYVSAGVASTVCRATVPTSAADCTVSAVATTVGASVTGGLVFRSDGSGNEYMVQFQIGAADTPKIFKGTAASYAILATGASTTVAGGSVISVELVGDTITVKDDGVTIVSVTDSSYSAQTRHGLYIVAPTGTPSDMRFDDFSVQP